MEYTANDMGVAMSYVTEGLCETVEEALETLELDGLLDWQQEWAKQDLDTKLGWDMIEAGEEDA